MNIQKFVTFLCLNFFINTIESKFIRNDSSRFVILPRYGILKGSIAKTAWTNRSIYSFLGVQYAESPCGNRRFKAPVPVEPWKGIRDARNLGRKCPTLKDLATMTEDDRKGNDLENCLNMAIYSPNLYGSLPVMIYIHGGSFYLNSAVDYPPNYFLERDIILVVVQYRLDALGFLSTNSDDIPGNAGLMDVQLALTFVKENIAHFGGNKNSLTLFGQSAGAAIVSALVISPAVPSNLFDRAIIQSGSVFSSWSVSIDPMKDARDIAEAAGLKSNESIVILNKAFMKMDVFDLLTAVDKYQKNGPLQLGARSISIGGPTNLLPDLPRKIVSSTQKKTIPMIIGTTKDDGSYVASVAFDFLLAYIQSTGPTNDKVSIIDMLMNMLLTFLKAGDNSETIKNILTSIFWTLEELASNDITKLAPGLLDLLGTIFFKAPALELALSNARSSNTFLYTFDYLGEKTRFGYGEDTSHYPFEGGVTHSDDLIYLFPYPLDIADLNKADRQMAQKLLDLWTSFAANAWPRSCLDRKFTWSPIISGTLGPYAHIDEELTIGRYYPNEFVRDLFEKNETDVRQLMAMLLN